MRKIIYVLLCILLLVGCTHQSVGNESLKMENGLYKYGVSEDYSFEFEILENNIIITFISISDNNIETRTVGNATIKEIGNNFYYASLNEEDNWKVPYFIFKVTDNNLYAFTLDRYLIDNGHIYGCADAVCSEDLIPTVELLEKYDEWNQEKYICTRKNDEINDNTIKYESYRLELDEIIKIPYYKTEFIPFTLDNEEVLKEISINIVDLALRNEKYHDFNYEDELFEYDVYFVLKENHEFDEMLVNFFGTTCSGYYRIRFNDSSFFTFDQYSVYYSSFNGALLSDDLENGSEVVMSFTDGDSTSNITYIRQNDYLIEIENTTTILPDKTKPEYHDQIMNGDFSAIAGVYENSDGITFEIDKYGVKNLDDWYISNIEYDAYYGFEGLYLASMYSDKIDGGILLMIIPEGVLTAVDESDISNTRISLGHVPPQKIEDIYYKKVDNTTTSKSIENGKYVGGDVGLGYYILEIENDKFIYSYVEKETEKEYLGETGSVEWLVNNNHVEDVYKMVFDEEYQNDYGNPIYIFDEGDNLYLAPVCKVIGNNSPGDSRCGVDVHYIFSEEELPTNEYLQKYDPRERMKLVKEDTSCTISDGVKLEHHE